MAGRIMKMREMLKEGLTREGTTVLLSILILSSPRCFSSLLSSFL